MKFTARWKHGAKRPEYEVVDERGRVLATCRHSMDAITIQEALNAKWEADTATPFLPGDRPHTPHYAPFG